MKVVLNGIVNDINQIRQAIKCPFCNGEVQFLNTRLQDYGNDRLVFHCSKDRINFELKKKRKDWVLSSIERRTEYELDKEQLK